MLEESREVAFVRYTASQGFLPWEKGYKGDENEKIRDFRAYLLFYLCLL